MTLMPKPPRHSPQLILSNGEHLQISFADNELHQFADVASDLFNSLSYQYSAFQQEHSLDLEDTANFQLRSLERHERLQKSMINEVIENQKEILEKSADPKEQTKRSNVIKL